MNAGIIALLGTSDLSFDTLSKCDFGNNKVVPFSSFNELLKDHEKLGLNITAIVSEGEVMDTSGLMLYETIRKKKLNIPFFLLSDKLNQNLIGICLQAGVAEVFTKPLVRNTLEKRIGFMISNWEHLQKKKDKKAITVYKTPLLKRSFDVFFSGLALIMLSPFILIVLIMMKLESRGPVLYYSLRVGTGYRVFKFYKFRSMYVNADKRLKELQHLNQYYTGEVTTGGVQAIALCDDCIAAGNQRVR